ncbi:3-hydroxyacyl-CoA dehydrogenase [Spectribacter hydrogenoxidans]|uniref:3-hydroxyacyl-CoA dehydrogenase n=1 Tax=Spectribacter hydrogenoxidans TaxID=3075608 RepID=A0ABU3BXH6_9GAMM|nr:3-hydroxyacyl-CoA dehydrogenase [Salinisphaera sp. W335]MDT0633831.1 3-hydroxyacyl-CoA dehydrogenase [Salinisphaera sp. W335]
MQIADRCFIVTGGGSGLGEATVRAIVDQGGRAVIADVNAKAGQALADALGDAVRFSRCDVTQGDDGRAAVELAVSEFGGLHGLVNCAGIGIPAKVLGKDGPMDLKKFSKVIEINLIGSFNMIRLAAEAMARGEPDAGGEKGVIINTASVAAFEGQIGQASYSASKGGVVGMTLPIARELARDGIRVMTIAPGLFDTPMMAGLPEDVRDSLGKQVPFPPRLGLPAEYARMARDIIENPVLNGTTIRLDGAIRMQPK